MELNNNSSNAVNKGRKPYIKPFFEIVSLHPKETVLGVCKSRSLPSNEKLGQPCNTVTVCSIDNFV